MTNKQQAHIIAAIGTALFLLLLFLLLWFVYIGAPVQEEDEGIEIAFGEMTETQSYASAAASEPVAPQAVTAPVEPATPTHNDLMTQEDEESLELARQREEEERMRREAEAERLRQEQAEAEQKAREDAAIAKANQMGSLFGNQNGGSAGSGELQGGSQKGNPVPGHGTIGGSSWTLAGRGVKKLPKPSSDFSQEGKVIVAIWVDASGNVIDAQVQGGTVSDKATQELARKAALQAKFTPAEDGTTKAKGTITYTFKFN